MSSKQLGSYPRAADDGDRSRRRWRRVWIGLLATLLFFLLAVTALVAFALGLSAGWVGGVVGIMALGAVTTWVFFKVLRRLLWRVGRRLAFTYFLVGVLPIPMVALLLAVGAYLVGGFFVGHLFREATRSVQRDVELAAEITLAAGDEAQTRAPTLSDIAIAYYHDGIHVYGDSRAPAQWPEWIEKRQLEASDPLATAGRLPPLVLLEDESLTVVAAFRDGNQGVVAFYDGHLESQLRERSGVWVELVSFEEEASDSPTINVNVMGERFQLQNPLFRDPSDEDEAQFLSRGGVDSSFAIQGFEVVDEILDFETGELVGERLSVSLAATSSFIGSRLFTNSREVDTLAWLVFVIPAFLLFDLFSIAWLMAVLMIVGLSLAVNRLSRATNEVQRGNFSVRIPVRRKDQIGALQASFNQMAEGLETSVASLAQKESMEKELAVARELQQNLIPSEIVEASDVEFATFFEPSAAIGGDYFDILPLDRKRLAVVIADVSGHGLSAGLRMAMLKAALLILIEEHDDADKILEQLDRVVRSGSEAHLFVTATLALLDLESGRLELTNAGHPPTYVVRDEGVQEIVLPGSPLGALGRSYGNASLDLIAGDTVVWLSDGFIEAANEDGELFGYERTLSCLEGDVSTAACVRDRLLEHVAAHTDGRPAEDDRTLVVMRYVPTEETQALPVEGAAG